MKRTAGGTVYVEYLVLAVLVAMAAVWFYNGGNYRGLYGYMTDYLNQTTQ